VDAILHNIRRAEDGLIWLTVSVASQEPRVFRATYDDSDPRCTFANIEQELFMALSELAFRRFGNCSVYPYELTKIIGAFCNSSALPRMPITLGDSSFCTLRPGRLRIVWNKFWILLKRLGLYRPRIYIAPADGGRDFAADEPNPL
jgi:hypothetical protein